MKSKTRDEKLKYHHKMNIGDYGEISFTLRKKRKIPIVDKNRYI